MRIGLLIWATLVLCACGAPLESSSSRLQSNKGADRFPLMPNPEVTPGEVCQSPDRYRYPEQIAYCERDVRSSTKREIIAFYDEEYGYEIGQMNRSNFKIDHYISLCMGGSNSRKNLWPQHKSVYTITDPLEPKLCRLMSEGKILQAEAIDMLKYAKTHLDEARRIETEVDNMISR